MFRSASDADRVIPISIVDPGSLSRAGDARTQAWIESTGYTGKPGTVLQVPDADGKLTRVLVGRPEQGGVWTLAGLPAQLPKAVFEVDGVGGDDLDRLAIGWAMGHYRFDRYKKMDASGAELSIPGERLERLEILRDAMFRVRNLVNTPAADLGPRELADEVAALAKQHGAASRVIHGEDLEREFPAIHAVGQAATRGPRLIKMVWGDTSHPSLALVGKGVIFDSGGLNIKPGGGMVLMKKDMGGAAHVIGLAELIMRLGIKVHLRVYIPAVENAIAGNAYRPSDILTTRSGTTVEIGNTDAEGRVVLSDALTLAGEEGASRIIDFATLTGAARVALGEDLPPLYARDDAQARAIQDLAFDLEDPLWHMPLYKPYKEQIQPKIADLSNTGTSNFGGSLTAALFLDDFVPAGIDWMHLDIYAWNVGDRPGRPAGGEAQTLRAMTAWLEKTYGR